MKTFLIAAGALLAAAPASAATIVLEDFESAPYAFSLVGNVQVANGTTYQACCGTTGTAEQLANNFVAFGGGNGPTGVVFSEIATIAGQSYTISFDYGALGASGAVDPLTLAVNSQSVRFERGANNNLAETFDRGTYTFTAVGNSTTFSFNSQGFANVDAVLDNVSLAGAVPEPATWGLMILGFGAVGGAMRRRKSVLATA